MTDVIIITGGSRGIGAACVELAAAEGKTVVFSYIANRKAADDLVAKVAAAGGKAVAVKSDVASRADCNALFDEAAKYGIIKGLINNAGIVGVTARLDEMTDERMERIMQVNIMGTLYCSQLAVRAMSTKHGGTGGNIVNLSSAAAVLGSPSTYVDYAASKGAIDTFTIGLARGSCDRRHSCQWGSSRHYRYGNSCLRRRTGPGCQNARCSSHETRGQRHGSCASHSLADERCSLLCDRHNH